ncbi:MAG TPA: zinc ribbon domain-containing protein [Pyrinomonadaceae bacterium]
MNLICRTCGTELLNGVSFCRKCGAAVNPDAVPDSSELTTSLLPETNTSATHRLDSRPTSEPQRAPMLDAGIRAGKARKPWTPVLALIVVGLIIATIVGLVAITRIRTQSRTVTADPLLYPGAQTLMDISNPDGGRALQLQTSDPLEKVEIWYDRNLRPTKTVRLTSSSVVLKNEHTTATIASEGGMTNILIKVIEK